MPDQSLSEEAMRANGMQADNFLGLSGLWKQAAGFGLACVLALLLTYTFVFTIPQQAKDELLAFRSEMAAQRAHDDESTRQFMAIAVANQSAIVDANKSIMATQNILMESQRVMLDIQKSMSETQKVVAETLQEVKKLKISASEKP